MIEFTQVYLLGSVMGVVVAVQAVGVGIVIYRIGRWLHSLFR